MQYGVYFNLNALWKMIVQVKWEHLSEQIESFYDEEISATLYFAALGIQSFHPILSAPWLFAQAHLNPLRENQIKSYLLNQKNVYNVHKQTRPFDLM